jgi:DNA-binding transcriptional ArsR family regulator
MSTLSKKVDGLRQPSAVRAVTGPAVSLTTEAWPAADLSMSMLAVVQKSAHRVLEDGDAWRRRATALGDDYLGTLDRYGKEVFINLLGLPFDHPEARTGVGLAACIGSLPATELLRYLTGYFRRCFRRETPAAVMDAAIEGDAAARREFRRTSFADDIPWRDTLRHLLGRDPDEIQEEFAGLVDRWQREVYGGELEEAFLATAARSLQAFRSTTEGLPLEQVVEKAAVGITFVPEAGQTEVVLLPSTAVRPLWAVTDHRNANVFAFPAPIPNGPQTSPPARLVALGKAIGDETRLRILRELASEPATPPDLAKRMGIPRTTLLHHLRILLQADLIAVQVHDSAYHQFTIRDEHFGEFERLLVDFLG